MKKNVGVVIGIIAVVVVAIIVFFGGLLYLGMKSSSFGLTEADKEKINQYLNDTYNYQFELVEYKTHSTGSGQDLSAIFRYDNKEFSVSMGRDREIYGDNFAYIYWFADDNVPKENDVIPYSLKKLSSIKYNLPSDTYFLTKYKKDFRNVTVNDIITNEKEKLEVVYRVTITLQNESVDYYKEDIYKLYNVMKDTGAGQIVISVWFDDNKGNRVDYIEFNENSNYRIDSMQDLNRFYWK